MLKKKILCFVLVVLTLLVVATPASAYSTTITRTSSGSFSKAWEAYTGASNWTMIYGFNTTAINEDYTHGNHSSKWHIVRVKNANGTFSNYDNAGDWAKKEVRHAGTNIRYIMEW